MALIFTSWVSQPDPLQWEICYIFLPFTKREKKKNQTQTKTPLWSLKTLSKAKWLRFPDSCRGLRIGAVKGCVTEVMHQEGSSLTPCLMPVQSSAWCFLRGCMWPTVCHLLFFLRAPGLLCPLCIFSGGCHCGSACSSDGSLHLRWLFAFGSKVGGAPSSLLWPFLVLLLDYSKGFGGKYGVQKDRMDKVSCQAMTSAHAQNSLVRSAMLRSLFLDTSPV